MKFRGSMVALVTPFADEALDVPALERLVELQLEARTDALVLCGTTGESPTLTQQEQDAIVRTVCRRAKGRCAVVVGSGTNSTDATLRLSQQARDAGANALMLVAPYYNKPTQEGLYRHFAAIASRVDLPIMLYNIPGRTAVEISQDTICRLFADFKNIVAVKHSTGSVAAAASLRAACKIDILSGDDPLTLPLMAIGAQGVVSVIANLVPAKVKALTDAFLAGRYDEARNLHEELLPLSQALLSLETNPIPIKTAMAMRGLLREEFRLPLCQMQPANKQQLQQVMSHAGLL